MSLNPKSESLGVTKSHFSVLSSSSTNTPARRYNARHLGIANTWKSLYPNLHAHRNERCTVRLPVINLDLIYMIPPQPKKKFLYFQSTVYKPFLFPVTSPPPQQAQPFFKLTPPSFFPYTFLCQEGATQDKRQHQDGDTDLHGNRRASGRTLRSGHVVARLLARDGLPRSQVRGHRVVVDVAVAAADAAILLRHGLRRAVVALLMLALARRRRKKCQANGGQRTPLAGLHGLTKAVAAVREGPPQTRGPRQTDTEK